MIAKIGIRDRRRRIRKGDLDRIVAVDALAGQLVVVKRAASKKITVGNFHQILSAPLHVSKLIPSSFGAARSDGIIARNRTGDEYISCIDSAILIDIFIKVDCYAIDASRVFGFGGAGMIPVTISIIPHIIANGRDAQW